MQWICFESNNLLLTICGVFYSVLCIFSVVTGLMYASGKRKLNPLELSDSFVSKLKKDKKLDKFAIKMGWVTFIVGIFQGLTAIGILYGYNVYLNYFALFFTIFSICSVVFKLVKKINLFSLLKLIAYLIILFIIIASGLKKYRAQDEALKYLETSDSVKVSKIKEGYFFDGPGINNAIIFYPGASVQYTSYSKLMYKFASNGYDSFLLSMPLDFAFLGIYKPASILLNYDYNNYYLMGHSLGGVSACLYASNRPEKISGVISLASYPTKTLPKDIKYISIYGSEDKVLNKQRMEESKQYYPEDSYTFIIEGGNHSSFGNYGNQSGDGNVLITNDQEQDYVVNKIIELLN